MRWLFLVSLGLVVAAAAPREPKKVHFAVCTAAGVEPGCVVARGDDGVLYNVGSTGVRPGQWLQGTAFVIDRMSYCMQGRTIAAFTPDPIEKPRPCGRR